MSSHLCASCSKIFIGNPKQRVENAHHESLQQFQDAKNEGCHLCTVIWNKIPKDIVNFKTTWARCRLFDEPREGILFNSQGSLMRPDAALYIEPAKEMNPGGIIHQPAIDTDSPETWDLLKAWLRRCDEDHGSTEHADSPLPDRIVDVGAPGDSTVKLVVINKAEHSVAHSRYLSLSHCWGVAEVLKLTTESLESFQKEICVKDMPRTFRHAIKATRNLGLQYIWIDSLCIIQNDDADWREQAAKMSGIYRGAYCNLSASSAQDSDGGMFFERDVLCIRPLKVTCSWNFKDSSSQLEQQAGERNCDIDDISRLEPIEYAPPNSRAWVFQERLLSRRIIHFGREQIVWECDHCRACETYPRKAPDGPASVVLWSHFWYMKNFVNRLRSRPPKDIYVEWRAIVELYSHLDLTFAKDRLIALSGLAIVVQEALRDKYIAGLWVKDIVHGLLWERKLGFPSGTLGSAQPGLWTIPSWSWANIGHVVTWDDYQHFSDDIKVQILDTGDVSGIRDTKELTASYICMRARIFDMPISQNKRFAPTAQTNRSSNILEAILGGSIYPAFLTLDSPDRHESFFAFRRRMPMSYGIVSFVPMAFCSLQTIGIGNRLYGLVVESTGELETYRRIGRLEMEIKADELRDVLDASDQGRGVPSEIQEVEDMRMAMRLSHMRIRSDDNESATGNGQWRTITLI